MVYRSVVERHSFSVPLIKHRSRVCRIRTHISKQNSLDILLWKSSNLLHNGSVTFKLKMSATDKNGTFRMMKGWFEWHGLDILPRDMIYFKSVKIQGRSCMFQILRIGGVGGLSNRYKLTETCRRKKRFVESIFKHQQHTGCGSRPFSPFALEKKSKKGFLWSFFAYHSIIPAFRIIVMIGVHAILSYFRVSSFVKNFVVFTFPHFNTVRWFAYVQPFAAREIVLTNHFLLPFFSGKAKTDTIRFVERCTRFLISWAKPVIRYRSMACIEIVFQYDYYPLRRL